MKISIMDYVGLIKGIGANKRLGQHFLINEGVARAEAVHARGKDVIELGPGLGILTEKLCAVAKHVTAVEKDQRLYDFLFANVRRKNLKLIRADFFDVNEEDARADMLVSNVPYVLSSKVLGWLGGRRMEAVLCLQREFVMRMHAKPGTRDYSKLSVFSQLQFTTSVIMGVAAGNFYPVPEVDSSVVYIRPKEVSLPEDEMRVLSLIMEHKNKKLRNAVCDSWKALGVDKHRVAGLADSLGDSAVRVSKLTPERLLNASKELAERLSRTNRPALRSPS